jgi:hypothetical protein
LRAGPLQHILGLKADCGRGLKDLWSKVPNRYLTATTTGTADGGNVRKPSKVVLTTPGSSATA